MEGVSCLLMYCFDIESYILRGRMMLERVQAAIAKRRNIRDNFRTENGYSWDYVFVFKVYKADDELNDMQTEYSMKRIISDLADGGLETRLFYSGQVCFPFYFCLGYTHE